MPVMSVAEFFQVLEKSSLLSEEQVQLARQQLAAESDPKNVARRLLADGRLTKWQARQLLHGRHALMIGPYKLLDQAAGDNVTRVFLAQHGQSGQKVELRSLSRSHAAERPDAVQEFVEAAEKLSVAENRKLVEVHRPEGQDDTCYVALEEPVGGVSAAAAVASSDSVLEVERATADQTQAADQPNADQENDAAEQPAQQETAAMPAATEIRPPKLKPKAKPATAASRPRRHRAAPRRRRTRLPPRPRRVPRSKSNCPGRMRQPRSPPRPKHSRSQPASAGRSPVPRPLGSLRRPQAREVRRGRNGRGGEGGGRRTGDACSEIRPRSFTRPADWRHRGRRLAARGDCRRGLGLVLRRRWRASRRRRRGENARRAGEESSRRRRGKA